MCVFADTSPSIILYKPVNYQFVIICVNINPYTSTSIGYVMILMWRYTASRITTNSLNQSIGDESNKCDGFETSQFCWVDIWPIYLSEIYRILDKFVRKKDENMNTVQITHVCVCVLHEIVKWTKSTAINEISTSIHVCSAPASLCSLRL